MDPIAVTVEDAAAITGDTRSHLYELIKTGELPSFKDGKRRKLLTRHLRERAERLVAEQAGQGLSDMGAAGREAMAAKREQEREARLAAAAAAKPTRRKNGRGRQ